MDNLLPVVAAVGPGAVMRVVIWITEQTWERCVAQARELLPPGAEVTLLHVAPADVEEVAGGARAGLLGRRPPSPPGPPLKAVSEAEARSLLAAAGERLGRQAELVAQRGRVEREVVGASAHAGLLVLARDGESRPGPRSLGPRTRFIVDHATCPVLLVAGAPAPVAAGAPPPPSPP